MTRISYGIFALWLAAAAFVTVGSAQPGESNVQREADTKFVSKFVEKLDARLKGKSVGFTFFASYKNRVAQGSTGGDARRAPDPNPRKMTVDDKFNIASVSKTITAAAVLKLLSDKGISVDTPVYTYLPTDWKLGNNFKTITFRELLTHRSGIRCGGDVSYAELKQCALDGVTSVNKAKQQYNNSNFGLFRIIIGLMTSPPFTSSPGRPTPDSRFSTYYSLRYLDYVRTNLFRPARLTGIDARPADSNPALTYQFPGPTRAGEDFGDCTELSGSQGWNMSSKQLAMFMDTLVNTERILPAAVLKQMKDDQLGWYRDATTVPGITSYEHTGYYPGKDGNGNVFNGGELNSAMFTFSNGLSVAVIINSQLGPGLGVPQEVKAALKDALK